MKDPTGKVAPAGGFQTGGWYSGYQYWDGSFAPTAGQIHPKSNQQGAGSLVSNEVIAQTNPDNVSYIENLRKTAKASSSPQQLTDTLNNYQSTLYNSSTSPEVKTINELKTELLPDTPKPEVLNRASEFEKLRTSQGVADLETSLVDLKAQQKENEATFRTKKGIEEGKPVPMGVISGRISEEQRQYQEQADFIGRQISRVTDELNTKYNVINTYMNFMNLDYQDAVEAYDREFDRNMKFYELVSAERKEAKDDIRYAQDQAKSNLQIYMNAITSGNMTYAELDPTQQVMINKLEVQAGLPVGTVGSMGLSAKDRLLGFSDDKTQAMVIGSDGNMQVISTGLRKSSGSNTESDKKKQAVADMAKTLNELGGSDFLVSPEEWKQARAVWISAGYSGDDFDNAFAKQYVDYSHPQDYGIDVKGVTY